MGLTHAPLVRSLSLTTPRCRFKPLVQLEEVETTTGEEDEDCLFEWCAIESRSLRSRSDLAFGAQQNQAL